MRSEQSAVWTENAFVLRQSMFGVSGTLERQGGPEPGGLRRTKITSTQLKTPQDALLDRSYVSYSSGSRMPDIRVSIGCVC